MPLTETQQREFREIKRRIRERDEAEGITRSREAVPRFLIAEDKFITDAAAEKDAAWQWIDARIKALPGEGGECEREFTLHLRRPLDPDIDLTDGVEDLFLTACCGNQSCAHCWRKRLARSIHRAASCLLDDNEPDHFAVAIGIPGKENEEKRVYTTEKAAREARRELHQQGHAARVERVRGRLRPRVAAVYVAETTWKQWKEFDKSLRKQLPHKTGRLRVRRGDDTVFVAAELPFDGSRCVSPAEAAKLATAAIEQLHRRARGKHAFRMTGVWNDAKKSTWELKAKLPVVLDHAAVDRHIERIGSNAKRLGHLPGFLIRSSSEAEADLIGRQTQAAILKSITVQEEDSVRRQISACLEGDGFDLDEAGIPDGFDPGGNPWRT